MLTKVQSKYIRSLSQQKYRKQYNTFIAEGDKIAREWLASQESIELIICEEKWAAEHRILIGRHDEAELCIVERHQLEAISTLHTPNMVLLVVKIPAETPYIPAGWCLALDDIQDPGNMGTIIRIADWFGVRSIICSDGCVDVYNTKVVQAAMGGHLRVNITTGSLADILPRCNLPVFAAALEGISIYKNITVNAGILIIGNESKGISDTVIKLADHKITIPRIGGAESLNAGVSAGILCAHLIGRNA